MSVIEVLHACDTRLFFWVQRLDDGRRSQRIRWARRLSQSANGPLYLILMLVLAALGTVESLELLNRLVFGLLIERIGYFSLKNLFRRHRPTEALKAPGFITPGDRFSFPSGHTSAAFLVATGVAFSMPWLTPLVLSWAMAVGLARVILGVHFPGDILSGASLGSFISYTLVSAGFP
jgi:undecaprenyl-diphosphatase